MSIDMTRYSEWKKNHKLTEFGFVSPIDKSKQEVINMGEWKKIEAQTFKFDKVGAEIEGELVGIEDSKTYGNKLFKIETEEGVKAIFGTSVMESQMMNVKIGDYIKIVFTGTQPNKKKGQNDIKLFDVFVKEE